MTRKNKSSGVAPGDVGFQFDLFAPPQADEALPQPEAGLLNQKPSGQDSGAAGTLDGAASVEEPDEAFELTPFQAGQLSSRSPYAPELIERARELFARGTSYKSAAYALGIPVYTAREWMHRYRNGTFDVRTDRPHGRYSQRTREEVVRMRTELGMSYNRIVKETGISRATVRSWLGGVEDDDREVEQFPDVVKGSR